MTLLDVYYETEWKQKCPKSRSFLGSWQGLALVSHSFIVVFLPFYMFTAYCILKKTPKSMSAVKFVLLNSHLWSSFVDIMISSLITPFLYFPSISGFPVGLFRVFGISTAAQIYMGSVACLYMGTSLIGLFENRSSSIPTNRFRVTKSRRPYYFVICTAYTFFLLPVFLNLPDQTNAMISMLKDIPCPSEEFFYTQDDFFVLAVDAFWHNYLWVTTSSMIVSICLQVAFFALCCVYYLFLTQPHVISAKTRKYQRAFFIGTLAQTLVPFFFLSIPAVGFILCIRFNWYNQTMNNLAVLVFSLHGFASTLVILLVHHPYRSFLLKLIRLDRSGGKNASTSASGARVDVRVGGARMANRVQPI